MVVLLVVGLGIGAGVGYFSAPKGGETIVEVPVEVPVEVHPLAGMNIELGITASSTDNMEFTQPLVEDIMEPDLNDYLDKIGLDITMDFLLEDNQGTASIALEKTQTYKAMGINLVIGHGWSSQCGAALSYVNENDMILLSASSTSPLYAIADDMLFRTCPTDFVQSPAIAEMWLTWGAKGVLTMHRADAWGDGLWNILEGEFEKRGIENLGRIRYAGEVTEFSSYLTNANDIITAAAEKYGGLEYVGMEFFSFNEFRTIQAQASDYPNLMDIIWMGTESNGRSTLMMRENGPLCTQTRHFSSLMGVDEGSYEYMSLQERYNAETEAMPSFYDCAMYDAGWLMIKSVLETGSIEAEPISNVLISMSEKHHGTSGWLVLDDNGDRRAQIFDLWGFYETDTGEPWFRSWGKYDGRIIQVNWDDAALLEYAGLVRPGA